MENTYALLLGFFGLFLGSFLHVIADRIVKGESLFLGRSHCDSCGKTLGVTELIPVVSYVLQKGRCRGCKTPFSFWYPLSELATGFLLTITFLATSTYPLEMRLFFLVLVSLLMVIFLADAKYGLIPFPIVLIAVIITVLSQFTTHPESLLISLISGLIVGGFFLLIFLLTKGKGMGFGDVIFAFFMGFLLGLPKAVVSLYLAFLTGAAVALILVLKGRKKLKGGTIAFGPFLVLGTIIALLFGDTILAYALQFLF